MSLHGVTRGTDYEAVIQTLANAEANAVMMYCALAYAAKEQGFDKASDRLVEMANQEAMHAGFYALLNGKYPKDFWGLMRRLQDGELAGSERIAAIANNMKESGFTTASDKMSEFAKQEVHHSNVLKKLLQEYSPHNSDGKTVHSGTTIYRCAVCGYEYFGDIHLEADDYVCPLCGQHKSLFEAK